MHKCICKKVRGWPQARSCWRPRRPGLTGAPAAGAPRSAAAARAPSPCLSPARPSSPPLACWPHLPSTSAGLPLEQAPEEVCEEGAGPRQGVRRWPPALCGADTGRGRWLRAPVLQPCFQPARRWQQGACAAADPDAAPHPLPRRSKPAGAEEAGVQEGLGLEQAPQVLREGLREAPLSGALPPRLATCDQPLGPRGGPAPPSLTPPEKRGQLITLPTQPSRTLSSPFVTPKTSQPRPHPHAAPAAGSRLPRRAAAAAACARRCWRAAGAPANLLSCAVIRLKIP